MGYRIPSHQETTVPLLWADDVKILSPKVKSLVARLREEFSPEGENAEIGLTFPESEGVNSITAIHTPIANGRIRLDYVPTGTHVVARLGIERESVSSNDSKAWCQVWALELKLDGTVTVYGDLDQTDLGFRTPSERDKKIKAYGLGMSIYYAIGTESGLLKVNV